MTLRVRVRGGGEWVCKGIVSIRWDTDLYECESRSIEVQYWGMMSSGGMQVKVNRKKQ